MKRSKYDVTRLQGELAIDHNRGVIYFHLVGHKEILKRNVMTVLRICNLPKPIPKINNRMLDITHMHGTDWSSEYYDDSSGKPMRRSDDQQKK